MGAQQITDPDDRMCSPTAMFAQLSWTKLRTPHNRAASWGDLMTEAERRYHEAKRLRRAGTEAA